MRNFLFNSVYYFCICCIAFLIPFGLTACSNDEFADYKKDGGLKSFTSFTATLDDVAGTRAYLDAEATNGIRRVHWEEGDVVSVYSDINPTLKKFVLTGIDENGVGTFTGENITGNYFYAVFAPGKEITVDASDPDVVHLKGAVFNKNMMADQGIAANFTAPMVATSIGSSFSFKQTTGLVKITVGNVHQVDDLFFRGSKLEPIGEDYLVDMSEDKPVLKLDERANIVSHNQIITDLDDKFVDVYFTLPPMVFENGFLLTITGVDAQGKKFEIDKSYNSRFEVKAGSISSFSLVDISAELEAQGSDEIIEFADENVKTICVANWDTNGDGALSRAEAAAVTDIGQIFKDNTDIKSFNELQYFTGVTSIGDWAFRGCKGLTSMVIPKGVTSIGDNAFYYCRSLTSIEIPEGVTSIGNFVFYGCSSLTSIVIPSGVTSIGYSAFLGCSSLTSIEIPSGVTSIGEYAFAHCSSLNSFTCLATNPPVYNNIFAEDWGHSYSGTIYVPAASADAYKAADGWSNYASQIRAIVIVREGNIGFADNNVKAICVQNWDTNGDGELSYAEAAAVTDIGRVFRNNTDIVSFNEFQYFTGVTSIGYGAFWGCRSLTSIVIPKDVTSIGEYAFAYCSSLTSFTCLAVNPPTYDNVFRENWGYSYTGIVYVPAASVSAYKAADGWKKYASQIQAIQE